MSWVRWPVSANRKLARRATGALAYRLTVILSHQRDSQLQSFLTKFSSVLGKKFIKNAFLVTISLEMDPCSANRTIKPDSLAQKS